MRPASGSPFVCVLVPALLVWLSSSSVVPADTLFSEDFEGAWPNTWYTGDETPGNPYWGDNSTRSANGSWSGWCADENNSTAEYANNMQAWMGKGNVSLVGYSQATLSFNYWMDNEQDYDFFTIFVRDQSGSWHNMNHPTHANVLPTQSNPYGWTGSSGGWVSESVDLSEFSGQSGLYVDFHFKSDGSIVREGVYVDDVVLTATGRRTLVFDPNPVNKLNDTTLTDQNDSDAAIPLGAYDEVDLSHLDPPVGGLYSLSGDYVVMQDIAGPGNTPPTSSSAVFHYYRSADEFEEVMCYYHITRSQDYIQSLGFTDVNNRRHPVDAHGRSDHNASYNGDGSIRMGDGGIDSAEDADAILHEYGHSIQDNSSSGKYWGTNDRGYGDETGAQGEGFGDYWDCSSSYASSVAHGYNPAYHADWVRIPFGRRVDTSKVYPDDMVGEIHADGEIWSACLWELFNSLGKTVTDKIVLKSHFLVPDSPSFEDGANAIISADLDLYSGSHESQIRAVFEARGILSGAYALSDDTPVSFSDIPKDFSFTVDSVDWCAVGIAPSTDLDIKADDDSDFSSPYQSSSYGGTTRDFVVANGHSFGDATHYAQVSFGSASSYSIEGEWSIPDLSVGSGSSRTMDSGEVFDVFEVSLTAGQEYDCSVDITSGSADVAVFIFSESRTSGERSDADWSADANGSGGDETVTFTASTSGDYGIVVVNENASSANYTITVSETTPSPPSPPTGVDAQTGSGCGDVDLYWNGSTGATGYKIYYDEDSSNPPSSPSDDGNPPSSTDVGDVTQVTITDLTPGATYYFAVVAYNAVGDSDYSSQDPTSIGNRCAALEYDSHQIDDDTSGGSNGNGDGIVNPGEEIELIVTLQNTGSADAHNIGAHLSTSDSYVTSISDADENYPDIATGATGQCLRDYDFTVSASCPDDHVITFNLNPIRADEGTWNDTFQITVQADPPPAPTGVDAQTGSGCGDVDLYWNGSTGATGYKIYYDEDSSIPPFSPTDSGTPPSATDVGNVTHVTVDDLNPGATYYFAVVAYNAYGDSDYSSQDSVASGNSCDGDTDGDGMPDWWEYNYSGGVTNLGADADMDGDGFSNLEEWIAATIADDSSSYFKIEQVSTASASATRPIIRWKSASNRLYDVDRSTNLLESFTSLATNMAATPPENSYTDTVGTAEGAFYMIKVRVQE